MRLKAPVVSMLVLWTALPVGGAERVSFREVLKLTASDTAAGDEFGTSVAMDGERLIVGAWFDDDRGSSSGSAYIFEPAPGGKADWKQVAKLVAPDGAAGDGFGGHVAISGDTAVVGATHQNDPPYSGFGYVFERDAGGPGSWGAVAKLLPADFEFGSFFGEPVAIQGDTVVVAASAADGPDRGGVGAVYVFERDAGGPQKWGQVAKLTPARACDLDPDATQCGWDGDRLFGLSAALGSDMLAVGGQMYFYLFRRVGEGPDSWWQSTNRVAPADINHLDGFGSAVAMSDETLLVGAQGDDDLGGQAGAAYVYEPDPAVPRGVRRTAKLYAPDGSDGIYFGDAVALYGQTAVVGAPDTGHSFRGEAYIVRRREGSAGGWDALARLEPAELEEGDEFSREAVAIAGATVAIGASGDDDLGFNSGAVYLYEETRVDPSLALDGTCPGQVVLAASGLTPKGEAAVYSSAAEGSFTVPDGFCAGTELGLERAQLVADEVLVGEAGSLRSTPILAEAACGSYLQLLDLTSCALSNVEPVP